LASGSLDTTIKIWDLKANFLMEATLEGHNDSILTLCFSPDGKKLASGSDDKNIKLWDL
jgi:WD40 repeat protein